MNIEIKAGQCQVIFTALQVYRQQVAVRLYQAENKMVNTRYYSDPKKMIRRFKRSIKLIDEAIEVIEGMIRIIENQTF